MNKLTILLCAISTLILATVVPGVCGDSDPGYGPYAPRISSGRLPKDRYFYKPTLRYYGKGYTVAYRFLPVPARSQQYATRFDAQQAQLTHDEIAQWNGKGEPRLTFYRSGGPDSYTKPPVLPVPVIPGSSSSGSAIVKESVQPNLPPVGEAPAKVPAK